MLRDYLIQFVCCFALDVLSSLCDLYKLNDNIVKEIITEELRRIRTFTPYKVSGIKT